MLTSTHVCAHADLSTFTRISRYGLRMFDDVIMKPIAVRKCKEKCTEGLLMEWRPLAFLLPLPPVPATRGQLRSGSTLWESPEINNLHLSCMYL